MNGAHTTQASISGPAKGLDPSKAKDVLKTAQVRVGGAEIWVLGGEKKGWLRLRRPQRRYVSTYSVGRDNPRPTSLSATIKSVC